MPTNVIKVRVKAPQAVAGVRERVHPTYYQPARQAKFKTAMFLLLSLIYTHFRIDANTVTLYFIIIDKPTRTNIFGPFNVARKHKII